MFIQFSFIRVIALIFSSPYSAFLLRHIKKVRSAVLIAKRPSKKNCMNRELLSYNLRWNMKDTSQPVDFLPVYHVQYNKNNMVRIVSEEARVLDVDVKGGYAYLRKGDGGVKKYIIRTYVDALGQLVKKIIKKSNRLNKAADEHPNGLRCYCTVSSESSSSSVSHDSCCEKQFDVQSGDYHGMNGPHPYPPHMGPAHYHKSHSRKRHSASNSSSSSSSSTTHKGNYNGKQHGQDQGSRNGQYDNGDAPSDFQRVKKKSQKNYHYLNNIPTTSDDKRYQSNEQPNKQANSTQPPDIFNSPITLTNVKGALPQSPSNQSNLQQNQLTTSPLLSALNQHLLNPFTSGLVGNNYFRPTATSGGGNGSFLVEPNQRLLLAEIKQETVEKANKTENRVRAKEMSNLLKTNKRKSNGVFSNIKHLVNSKLNGIAVENSKNKEDKTETSIDNVIDSDNDVAQPLVQSNNPPATQKTMQPIKGTSSHSTTRNALHSLNKSNFMPGNNTNEQISSKASTAKPNYSPEDDQKQDKGQSISDSTESTEQQLPQPEIENTNNEEKHQPEQNSHHKHHAHLSKHKGKHHNQHTYAFSPHHNHHHANLSSSEFSGSSNLSGVPPQDHNKEHEHDPLVDNAYGYRFVLLPTNDEFSNQVVLYVPEVQMCVSHNMMLVKCDPNNLVDNCNNMFIQLIKVENPLYLKALADHIGMGNKALKRLRGNTKVYRQLPQYDELDECFPREVNPCSPASFTSSVIDMNKHCELKRALAGAMHYEKFGQVTRDIKCCPDSLAQQKVCVPHQVQYPTPPVLVPVAA